MCEVIELSQLAFSSGMLTAAMYRVEQTSQKKADQTRI